MGVKYSQLQLYIYEQRVTAVSSRRQMEPGVKLFPAVFVEATSKDVLQIELGRTPTSLPLSAAVLQSSEKHVVPQASTAWEWDCCTILR